MKVELKVYAPVNTYTGSVFHTLMIAKTGIYKELIELCPGLQIAQFSSTETALFIRGDDKAVTEWLELVKEYNKNFSRFANDVIKQIDKGIKKEIKSLSLSTKHLHVVEYIDNKWERYENWFDNPKEKFKVI